MQTIIFIIWGAIPAFFFFLALWHSLQKEARSSVQRKAEIADLWKQGFFVTGCVVVTYFLYESVYRKYISDLLIQWVPDFVAQILLLPIVLYTAASLIGPSKEIRIEKAPDLKKKKR